VDLDPHGRREFFAGAGGLLLCTLAGQKVLTDRGADVDRLATEIAVPPKVRSAEANGAGAPAAAASPTLARAGGARREYWLRAEPVRWNIVPSGRDAMMDRNVRAKATFTAYAYRAYT
jgi:hypothetical protein